MIIRVLIDMLSIVQTTKL